MKFFWVVLLWKSSTETANNICVKLLVVKIDSKLTCVTHVNNICKKAGQKLNALSKIAPYLDFDKKRLLLNVFFLSQFNYCQLTWMCHNCTINNKINRLHERCLRLIYSDRKYCFEELLEKVTLSLFTIETWEYLLLECARLMWVHQKC